MLNISQKKLLLIRFLLNPNFIQTQNPNSLNSAILSSTKHPIQIYRCFSASSANQNIRFENTCHAPLARKKTLDRLSPPVVPPNLVSQLIDVITSSNGNCRSKLDSMGITRLPTQPVCEILRVLSCERVSGLQFFEWVRANNTNLYCNSDICSLMIDNCGWLGDYETMTALLKGFNKEQICLTDKAFAFLPVLDSSKARAIESIESVIGILNKIGGSTRSSGVFAMIDMLCVLDCFELARFVMEITEKKLSFFAVLVRENCKRGRFEDARALIDEIREAGCDPNARIYNYILGSLCKSGKISEARGLLEEMIEKGVHPDAITFEIFISNSCKLGNLEFVNQILERLALSGLVPRLSTHVAFVKGCFEAGRYEEAYGYVRDIEVKKMPAANRLYSLLARLHQRKGDIDLAQKILDEMMEKGLKPHYSDYVKTVNVLRHTGGGNLAKGLQERFSRFRV